MKRGTDEIRYRILKKIDKNRSNIESIRAGIGTGLPTILQNSRSLEKLGFVKIYETKAGKKFYRELEITDEGKEFLKRLEKLFDS